MKVSCEFTFELGWRVTNHGLDLSVDLRLRVAARLGGSSHDVHENVDIGSLGGEAVRSSLDGNVHLMLVGVGHIGSAATNVFFGVGEAGRSCGEEDGDSHVGGVGNGAWDEMR